MTASTPRQWPGLHVREHEIPMPTTISAEAQAITRFMQTLPDRGMPDTGDPEAWRAAFAARPAPSPEEIRGMALACNGTVDAGVPTRTEQLDLAGFPVYVSAPEDLPEGDDRVLLNFHGGGFCEGGGDACRVGAGLVAGALGMRVWSVDYRMPPEHPFPAAVDDAVAAYRALLTERDPASIAVGGVSAGANLSAVLLLRAREEGLPMPGRRRPQLPAG